MDHFLHLSRPRKRTIRSRKMKQRFLIFTMAVALVAMVSCKKSENYATTDTSNGATDTSVTASDTSSTTTTNSGTTATTGTTTSQSSTPLSDDDKKFMTKAAEGGLAEVSLGT